MILIDFGIICMGQKRFTFPPHLQYLRYDVHPRRRNAEPMYGDTEFYHFETADRVVGNWYFVWMPKETFLKTSFVDIADRGSPYIALVPEWESSPIITPYSSALQT